MRHARAGASAVVLKGKIYIIGGFGGSSGQETLDSVEVFNPKDKTWQTLAVIKTNAQKPRTLQAKQKEKRRPAR